MIFNLAQKYIAVAFKFFNTFFILSILDLEYLGKYAFVLACSNLLAIFMGLGIRNIYLREYLRTEMLPQERSSFVVFAELFPKVSGMVITLFWFIVLYAVDQVNETYVAILVLGLLESTTQISSQKLRSKGFNTLSQLVLNIRPVIVAFTLWCVYVFNEELLRHNFLPLVVLGFSIPAMLAYIMTICFYLQEFSFSAVNFQLWVRAKQQLQQATELIVLSIGGKAQTRLDVVFIGAMTDLSTTGIYRVASQIVSAATASLYPIQSAFLRRFGKAVQREDDQDADEVITEAQGIAVPLYLGVLAGGVIVLYSAPIFEPEKYGAVFIYTFSILCIGGLIKMSIPLVDSFVIFKEKQGSLRILKDLSLLF